MSAPKIVVFSGSARAGSDNKKVAAVAAKALAEKGADVTHLDLNDFDAPLYHGDLEEASGVPESMQKLAAIVAEADGLAISTPEYNGCVPPLLVNVFSWLSRVEGGVMNGKRVALMAASPGGLGGVRVIPRLRDEIAELGMTAIPGFVTVGASYQAFNEDGTFADDSNTEAVAGLMGALVAELS